MEVFFATLIKGAGVGTHVRVEFDVFVASTIDLYEEINPQIGILFNETIEDIFKEGGVFIKKAILDHFNEIKSKIETPIVLYISKVSADRVDYEPIAFFGATIMWLNEYFGTDMKIPEYTYDRSTRTFGICESS